MRDHFPSLRGNVIHALVSSPSCPLRNPVLAYHLMKCDVIVADPEILSGTPVFRGTRVPVKNLLDYLEAGDDIGEFLDDFPSVSREQVVKVLEAAKAELLAT